MEEIEAVDRPGLAVAVERGVTLPVADDTGGLEVDPERPCRDVDAGTVFLTPSETDARGRAGAFVSPSAEDTEARDAEADGLALVEEARVDLATGAGGLEGTVDVRLAAAEEVAGGAAVFVATVGLEAGWADEALTDFLTDVAGVALEAAEGALVAAEGLWAPVPKVPELRT